MIYLGFKSQTASFKRVYNFDLLKNMYPELIGKLAHPKPNVTVAHCSAFIFSQTWTVNFVQWSHFYCFTVITVLL